MTNFKQGNALKATGVIVALVGALAVLVLAPNASGPTATLPEVDVPSMVNVPPDGYLHFENAPRR
jgi:hypothetical protein